MWPLSVTWSLKQFVPLFKYFSHLLWVMHIHFQLPVFLLAHMQGRSGSCIKRYVEIGWQESDAFGIFIFPSLPFLLPSLPPFFKSHIFSGLSMTCFHLMMAPQSLLVSTVHEFFYAYVWIIQLHWLVNAHYMQSFFHELMHSVKREVCVLSVIVQLCSLMMDPWNRITLYPVFDVFIGPSLGNTGLHTSLCKTHPSADLHPLTLCFVGSLIFLVVLLPWIFY